jgi:dTDP-4-amino-4,6-dideoxygalactose transaminase
MSSVIPLCIPNIGERERTYLNRCVDDNFVSSVGPFVDEFEERVGRLSGGVRGVSTSSGTTALHLGLVVLGVRPGDLVVMPSFTFIATANAVSHAGAEPWLADIDRDTWTLCPARLERMLADECEEGQSGLYHKGTGRRVSCVIPVYTLGNAPDMKRIKAVAERFRLPVLADAAAALGVRIGDEPLAPFADLSSFSFNGNKIITTGGGGMLVGTDAALLQRAKHLSSTARRGRDYDHDEIGFNYRLTNIAAAVGLGQMDRLDEFLAAKKRIFSRYADELAGAGWLQPMPLGHGGESNCWFSAFQVDLDSGLDVAAVCARLSETRIEARPFWKPVHLQAPYSRAPRGSLANTESIWDRIITLPCSTQLSAVDQERVIAALKAIAPARASAAR